MYPKPAEKQRFLAIAVLAAVLALLAGWYFTLRKGVYVGDKFYYKTSDTRYAHSPTRTIELTSDAEFTILSGSDRQTVSFRADGSRITFTFPDGESLAGTWNGDDLMGPKGLPLGWDEINILINGEPDRLSNPAWGLALGRIYFGKTETISDWFVPFLGILIYIIGIATILKPDEVHFFLRRWQYTTPELSDSGRTLERISGAAIAVLGLAVMSGLLLWFLSL
ncbi:MAG TPA: hypothetical protein DF613_01020 [Lachnospiraceae bacterium]|nr:hypothetical protein [Lachnospiraceae bacterium]